jgi:hypothetical protein
MNVILGSILFKIGEGRNFNESEVRGGKGR